jgi:hypothetical protein
MTEYPIGGVGYVLVEVESRYENKTGAKGVGGQDIIVDTRWEPLKYVKTCGKVVQVPYAMGERIIRQISIGFPGYGARRGKSMEAAHAAIYAIGGVYKYKRLSDIAPEVKIGDTIWFNRGVLNREENIVDEFDRDGVKVYIFKVDYDLVICIEREDGPQMIGGWCFLEPMFENWRKTKIPTFYEAIDKEGNKVPKPESEWIVTAMQPSQEKLMARLICFGTPLKGDTFEYPLGATVFIRKQVKWGYQYKGRTFTLIPQWDIFAHVVEIPDPIIV